MKTSQHQEKENITCSFQTYLEWKLGFVKLCSEGFILFLERQIWEPKKSSHTL